MCAHAERVVINVVKTVCRISDDRCAAGIPFLHDAVGIHTIGKRERGCDIDIFEYTECRRYGYIVLHAVAPISDKIGFEKHVLFGLYRVFEISGVIETYFFIPLFFSYPVFAFEGVDTAHVDGKIGEGYV